MIRHAHPGRDLPVSLMLSLALLLAAAAAVAAAPSRDDILDLLRAGDRAAALPLAREYAAAHPEDADMLYNLGCLEADQGTSDRALAALRSALDLRVDALDGAATDPDLDPLRDDPGFQTLLAEHADRLNLLAIERGVDLAVGERSGPLPLHPRAGDETSDPASLRLRWEQLGLDIELKATGLWAGLATPGAPAPWKGGPALVLTLGVPDGEAAWSTSNYWIFAFGLENDAPVGAVRLPGQERWQRVLELDPKLRYNAEGDLVLKTTVPWAALMPFHPLVDPVMGLNAALAVPDPGGRGARVAELLPDPVRFTPTAAARRVVPMEFETESWPEEAFLGRLDDSISGDAPLPVTLVALTEAAGRGVLTVDVLDGQRRSVVPGGARAGGLDLARGETRVERELDFGGLRDGYYLVRATLQFPTGREAVWSSSVLHLQTGWADSLSAEVEALADNERPTGRFLLDQVTAAVEQHIPRRTSGPIATTHADLLEILANARRTGTIMPRDGRFMLVAEGPDGQPRICNGYIPAAPPRTLREVVLILPANPGEADRYADRLQRFYEHERPARGAQGAAPLYIVPQLPPAAANDPMGDLVEARVFRDWVLDHFGVTQVALAGADEAAGTALRLAAEAPERIIRLAVMAGAGTNPWPGADNAALAGLVTALPTDFPVAWYDFAKETQDNGQSRAVRTAMADAGMTAVTDIPVRGGLNLTQASDRIVLWSEKALER